MEIPISNLTAEKGKDGNIYVYFVNGQLSEYRICVQVIEGEFITWESEGVVRRAIV